MTLDERLHYLGGFWMGVREAWKPLSHRLSALATIYRYGWDREVAQHDPDLSPHQIAEAKAWGDGAAKALRLPPIPPSPPYPTA